jgi:hypothetical protein
MGSDGNGTSAKPDSEGGVRAMTPEVEVRGRYSNLCALYAELLRLAEAHADWPPGERATRSEDSLS